jgi:hypothetical protein
MRKVELNIPHIFGEQHRKARNNISLQRGCTLCETYADKTSTTISLSQNPFADHCII